METMHIAEQLVPPSPPPPLNAAAYAFVRQLAEDLSGKVLELPGYSKVALRVQKLLGEDDVTSERLVRLLAAEPTLAGRILTLANSAAHNPSSQAATDLRTAVLRLGFDALRTAVISFAMAQQREAAVFAPIQRPMRALWERSVEVSALCFVLARLGGRFHPDTALLTGVVSGVGKLYIMTRSLSHPDLVREATTYADIIRDWHANIAHAVLESWEMPEAIASAVRDYEDVDTELRRAANLADLLAAAHALAACKDAPELLDDKVLRTPAFARLSLDAPSCRQLLEESAQEIAALRAALAD